MPTVMPPIQTSIETVRRAHEVTLAELSACRYALDAALARAERFLANRSDIALSLCIGCASIDAGTLRARFDPDCEGAAR